MSHASENVSMAPTRPRRKKNAAERRAQALRSEGRRLLHLVRSLEAIQEHRGNALGATGKALLTALSEKDAKQSEEDARKKSAKQHKQHRQFEPVEIRLQVAIPPAAQLHYEEPVQLDPEDYEPRQHGFEQHGFEQHGFEQHGFEPQDFQRRGFEQGGFENDPMQYDMEEYEPEQHGFEQRGLQQHGFEQTGFEDDLAQYDFEEPTPEQPLWLRDPKDVTNEQYTDFYKDMTQNRDEPLAVKHFVVKAQLQFSALLFVPLRSSCLRQRNNIKIYFDGIPADDNMELIPDWLDFVKGVIHFADMPLALPWEERCLRARECIVQACIEMFTEIAGRGRDSRAKSYMHFGKHLKTSEHWKVTGFLRRLHLLL
eukprot:TRINITY_DN7139_c0_g1_i6.p1 TRINITY_DN7139_c0_g1~~TRINITY_DN7139_c0_g1_i6.p1  ORF type:complete len:369 (+),score=80.74 TRINITY_DN7139_c0_g1_i6:130-1236(+)